MKLMMLVILVIVVAQQSLAGPANKRTLYDRVGGKKKISRVVNDFLGTIATDPRLLRNPKYKAAVDKVDRKKLQDRLAIKVCEAIEGPCKLEGNVIEGDQGDVRLTPLEWLFVVEDLNGSLEKHKVPKQEQAELIVLLTTLRK